MVDAYKNLILKIEGPFAEVTLNRVDVRNSFNKLLIQELKQIFEKLSKDPHVRAITLRGAGKVFCAGADLEMMKEMVEFSLDQNRTEALEMYDMFDAIFRCDKPVIAVAHGAAFGGALGLLACADIVICEEKTQLCFSEVKLGLVPAVISHFLTKKISLGFLNPLMLTGRIFSANEALQMGLVHYVTETAEIDLQIKNTLESFKQVGPEAVGATKKLLQLMTQADDATARQSSSQVIAERRVSDEGQEGLKSFLEKRSCAWRIK